PQAPDVGARGERLVVARDHDAADLGIGVEALDGGSKLLHQLRREGVSRLGAVEPADRHPPVDPGLDEIAHDSARGGVSAFTPVAARPMISLWIWEVPS